MASVGELFIMLGFEVDEAKLRNFQDGIIGARNEMALLAGTAAAAVYGIDKFISPSITDATRLENLSDLLGVAADVINKWEYAANEANPLFSKEAAGESIKNIQSVFAAIASGSSSAPTNSFLAMGLSANDAQKMNAIQFLEYVRSHFEQILSYENKLHSGKGLQFMQQDLQNLGVAGGMWQMLRENQDAFNKSMSEANSQNGQLEQNKKLLQSINDLSNAWDNFKMKLIGNNANDMISDLDSIAKHAERVKDGFEALPDAIKYGAPIIAGALLVISSPLAAIALSLAGIVATLDYIGSFKDKGGFWNALNHSVKPGYGYNPDSHYMADREKAFKDFFGISSKESKDYGTKFGPFLNAGGNSKVDNFAGQHQVQIDHWNAEANFLRNNRLTDAQKSNQNNEQREISKFVQTNHFNIQTEKLDDDSIDILMRELKDTMSKTGNDPR